MWLVVAMHRKTGIEFDSLHVENPNTNNNPAPISNPAIANRSCNFLLYLQTRL